MALVKGTNSYVTVEEANLYFDDRLDSAAWIAASNAEKAKALVQATDLLDELNWTGYAVSDSQELAFPRVGEYFDPRVGTSVILDPESVPKRVIEATYQLARHLLTNAGILDDTGSVESLSVGPVVLTEIRAPARIPTSMMRGLKPLLVNAGSNTWWRAN